jgi:hypothetical protein
VGGPGAAGDDVLKGLNLTPIPTRRGEPGTMGSDLEGFDLAGGPVQRQVVGIPDLTLLFFVTSSCDGCRDLWHAGRGVAPFGDVRVVFVTKDLALEDPETLRALAGDSSVSVVSSSAAWAAYGVLGPPFFVLVDGESGCVLTEGVPWGVEQVAGHVERARRGEGGPDVPRLRPGGAP